MNATATASSLRSWWIPGTNGPRPDTGAAALQHALHEVTRPFVALDGERVARGGSFLQSETSPEGALPARAWVPALTPEHLGDPAFRADHGVRLAYCAGAMANGIASEALVQAMAEADMLAFFGAAGLAPDRVAEAITRIQAAVGGRPYGFNLIHSPAEPGLEDRIVDLYLGRGVRRVCASAFLTLTLPVVRFRFAGIHRDESGAVVTPNQVLAKVSRVEVARPFMSPAPDAMLQALVEQGHLTRAQAEMAALLPVAQDITAEADSGGHTDNRPALALLPTLLALRDELQQRYEYPRPLRVGLAGGIGTPASAAAAFAMGAAYVMTGSVNQACVEAGTSQAVREMLARAGPADVAMAPAADMFEMGVRVQVLKWGTMFPVKARKLYDLYRGFESLDSLPAGERAALERDFFRCTLEEEWEQTRRFFQARDPRQIERAESDPRHKMALLFRSYLGRSSGWANAGEGTRRVDYQIWCGPAMGAFNEWVRGSFLEDLSERRVSTVAFNLMMGAAVLTRAGWLRAQGVSLPPGLDRFEPMRPERIAELCSI